jgi:hypothetical protein
MGIRINVSDKAVPRKKPNLDLGWYTLRINDVELRASNSEKNPDKPMYNFEVEVTEDSEPFDENGASKYAGYIDWVNACLWEGAEFTIVGILNALGKTVEPGELDVPDITDENDPDGGIEFFRGRTLQARWGIRKKERIAATKEGRTPEPEWTTFRAVENDDEVTPSTATAVPATGRRRALA